MCLYSNTYVPDVESFFKQNIPTVLQKKILFQEFKFPSERSLSPVSERLSEDPCRLVRVKFELIHGPTSGCQKFFQKLCRTDEVDLFSFHFPGVLIIARLNPTNGRRRKTDFWCFRKFFSLVHAAKTPQIRHFVRFCGVFAAPQKFDIKGAANGAANSKNVKIFQKRCKLRCRKNDSKSNKLFYLRRFCGAYK